MGLGKAAQAPFPAQKVSSTPARLTHIGIDKVGLRCVLPSRYRGKDLKDNYCRNPNNRLRPWCYTMDPKTPWEYCNITVCGKGPVETLQTVI